MDTSFNLGPEEPLVGRDNTTGSGPHVADDVLLVLVAVREHRTNWRACLVELGIDLDTWSASADEVVEFIARYEEIANDAPTLDTVCRDLPALHSVLSIAADIDLEFQATKVRERQRAGALRETLTAVETALENKGAESAIAMLDDGADRHSRAGAGSSLPPIRTLGDWEWLTTEPVEPELLFSVISGAGRQPWMTRGNVGLLVGEGGVGKSYLATQMALAAVNQSSVFPLGRLRSATSGDVVLICAEENPEQMHRRIQTIAKRGMFNSLSRDQMVDGLRAMPAAGFDCRFLQEHGEFTPFLSTLFRKLERDARNNGYQLIVFDPLSRFAGPDAEKDNAVATRFVQALERFTNLPGLPAVVATHHTAKAHRRSGSGHASAARGSSAFVDGARWVANLFTVEKDEDGEKRSRIVLEVTKSNYTRLPPPMFLKRDELTGVLIEDHDDVTESRTGEDDDVAY